MRLPSLALLSQRGGETEPGGVEIPVRDDSLRLAERTGRGSHAMGREPPGRQGQRETGAQRVAHDMILVYDGHRGLPNERDAAKRPFQAERLLVDALEEARAELPMDLDRSVQDGRGHGVHLACWLLRSPGGPAGLSRPFVRSWIERARRHRQPSSAGPRPLRGPLGVTPIW